MIRALRLWLLRWREVVLEGYIDHGENSVTYTRARLQQSYRELRQVRTRIAELTPAHRLLKEMAARRRRSVASR